MSSLDYESEIKGIQTTQYLGIGNDVSYQISSSPTRLFGFQLISGTVLVGTDDVDFINGTADTDPIWVLEDGVHVDGEAYDVDFGRHGLFFPNGLRIIVGDETASVTVHYRVGG